MSKFIKGYYNRSNDNGLDQKRRDREYNYVVKYGITLDEYEWLLTQQNGCCAGCGTPPRLKRLVVDHDHTNGRIRGLLCGRCNSFVNEVFDNPDILKWALNYSKCRR